MVSGYQQVFPRLQISTRQSWIKTRRVLLRMFEQVFCVLQFTSMHLW